MKRLTLARGPKVRNCCDRFTFDFLASPFAHETGLYFEGRRYFTLPMCGLCSFFSLIVVAFLFYLLIWPALIYSTDHSDLRIDSFKYPQSADIPSNLGQIYGY